MSSSKDLEGGGFDLFKVLLQYFPVGTVRESRYLVSGPKHELLLCKTRILATQPVLLAVNWLFVYGVSSVDNEAGRISGVLILQSN
jgi:hypothetical protein